MSKKLSKRRSRGEITGAAVNAHLGTLADCVDKVPSTSDLGNISSCTSRILSLAASEGSERKALAHKTSGGICILLKTLKAAKDQVVVSNVLSILSVLASYKYIGHMIRDGAVTVVLNSFVDAYHAHWGSQELLIAHVNLLNRLSHRDRKFGMKARLCGSLPIIFKLVKSTQEDYDKLIVVLSLLKSVSQNSINAMYLGKLGTLRFLVNLVSKIAQSNLVVVKYCIDILALLFKLKANVSKPVAQECVKQLLHLHQVLHRIDTGSRHILVRKKTLQCLKLCIAYEANLQVFHRNGGLQVLYFTANQDSKKADSRALESLTCMVLRKGLPPVELPLKDVKNTTQFPLPLKSEHNTEERVILSESSSAKTTASDLLSQSGSKELEAQSEPEEGLCVNGISLSKASTSLQPFTMKRLEKDVIGALHRHSTSDSLTLCSNQYSDECIQTFGNSTIISSQESSGKVVAIPSVDSNEVDLKLGRNLEQFVSFFPELEESKNYWFPLQSLTSSYSYNPVHDLDQWNDMKEICSPELDTTENIVTIPDVAECENIDAEVQDSSSLNGTFVERSPVKSVINFVEEPLPQQLGPFLPPPSIEPLYSKRPSVDRKLSLLDIERFTNPNSIINRVVFDLDSLLYPNDEKPCSSEPRIFNPFSTGTDSISNDTNSLSTDTDANCSTGHNPISTSATPLSTGTNPVSAGDEDEMLCTSLKELAMLQAAYSSEDDMEVGSEHALTSDSSNEQVRAMNGYTSSSNNCVLAVSSHLEFESRFESGNLRKAVQVRQYEYDLLLNADINANHHHQWFYFRVSNNEAGVPYRFNIINCEKPNSQFNYGMQPVMFSATNAKLKQQGWVRAGTRISYYKNNFTIFGDATKNDWKKKRKVFYTLTFTITFQHKMDTCYFAYHYPYTFSMLQMDLEAIEANLNSKDLYYHRQPLCNTLSGNVCPLITISSDRSSHSSLKDSALEHDTRHYIVLSARVHPGEANSSWIMRGLLNFLTSETPGARALRDKYIFKIVPMLNPDGVIHGSHRCSLCGEDLNRQWIVPDQVLHPTIYHTKSLLQWLVRTNRRPEVYCDFHGHSRKKNVFMYGCRTEMGHGIEQSVPLLMDKIAPFFSFRNCSFAVEKSKEATARVVVWRELGVIRSYTMESTYCGADQGQNKGRQVCIQDLEEIGILFCKSLLHLDEHSGSDIAYGRSCHPRSEGTLSSHSDSSSNKFMSGDNESTSSSSSEDQ